MLLLSSQIVGCCRCCALSLGLGSEYSQADQSAEEVVSSISEVGQGVQVVRRFCKSEWIEKEEATI